MDRQRRSASKITDYRRFHLLGDLDKIVQGKVSEAVVLLQGVEPTSMSTNDIEGEHLNRRAAGASQGTKGNQCKVATTGGGHEGQE